MNLSSPTGETTPRSYSCTCTWGIKLMYQHWFVQQGGEETAKGMRTELPRMRNHHRGVLWKVTHALMPRLSESAKQQVAQNI